ncbi:MAG: 6-phosphogluconolactonase [Hyphomonas sp.]|uniref:6-phosphogluconolactonase n=1 Tax=Hyphomonas sp. TaxID=87 RepID=UPI003527CF64
MAGDIRRFETREEATSVAAEVVLAGLKTALEEKGRASFCVSGGSTPGPLFDLLAATEFGWERVTVGLVDERWVSPEDTSSNERLVRSRLLTKHAGAAGFIPMRTLHELPEEAVAERNAAYAPHCAPLDVILLGMGNDGHTASWFPGAGGLANALNPVGIETVAAIDARGCPVAGINTQRMTLTGPAVASAQVALMLLFGNDKLDVYEQAKSADPMDMPVRYAIDKLGPRLTVIWAP